MPMAIGDGIRDDILNHLNISILILFGMGIWPVGKV